MEYRFYNPNPAGRNVSDCAVRAVAKALDLSWEEAFICLAVQGLMDSDLPHANHVWGDFLKNRGFQRGSVPDGITEREFADEHQKGTYVLAMSGHVATIQDNVLYDSWPSENEVVLYFLGKER